MNLEKACRCGLKKPAIRRTLLTNNSGGCVEDWAAVWIIMMVLGDRNFMIWTTYHACYTLASNLYTFSTE